MDEPVVRLLIGVAIVAVAVGGATLTRRFQRPTHRRVDPSAAGLSAGVVVFTSTECANCAAARDRLRAQGVAFREVTWELEPALFAALGVESVPLVVVTDPAGRWVGQISGKPPLRRLRSLAAAAEGPTVTDP